MAALTPANVWSLEKCKGNIVGSNTLAICLLDSSFDPTVANYSGLDEIAEIGGVYTAGGIDLSVSGATARTDEADFTITNDPYWTAGVAGLGATACAVYRKGDGVVIGGYTPSSPWSAAENQVIRPMDVLNRVFITERPV